MNDLQEFIKNLDSGELAEFSDALDDAHLAVMELLTVADCFADIQGCSWAKKIREMKHWLASAVRICEQPD